MFGNMNFVREVGLKYNVDTALYIQSVGVLDKFRRTNANEIRYHTSAALAYGYKNLKYFTWITPVERGEDFTLAIISPEGEKTDLFDGVAQINRDIKKVSSILESLMPLRYIIMEDRMLQRKCLNLAGMWKLLTKRIFLFP